MIESRKAIFLSYASQDAEIARRVADALREAELAVWFDQNELRGGDAWDAMLDAARLGKFDVLICEDISRLWRNRAEFGPRSAELEDLKVHMVTAVGDDTRRDGWGLTVQIKLAMAEDARREASYRTRRGLDGLARAGKHAGGKAYGYTSVDKVRTIDAAQAKVVRQIFEWRAEGWSAQRIARQLNDDKVPSPGSTWARTNTGPRRKPNKGWRPSAIAGDAARGVGILNNPMYVGRLIWGRSKWTRSAADSNNRKVEMVDRSEGIEHRNESLRIVPDALWEEVRVIQTAKNPRREAVKRGIAKGRNDIVKRVSGHDSKYWLGTLLVCGECGANYIGNGTRDFVCPAHTSNSCDNDMRFRREDAHVAVFDLLRDEMLSDASITEAKAHIGRVLTERQRAEDLAARDAVSGVDVKRLDDEIRALRKMALRPAALAAAMDEIEKERAELLAKAGGKRYGRDGRARQLLARMPEIVAAYRDQLQQALKVLADDRAVHAA